MTTTDDDLTALTSEGHHLEDPRTEDPRTDIEALCLCALLWAPASAVTPIAGLLEPRDFHDQSTQTCSRCSSTRCVSAVRTIPRPSPLPSPTPGRPPGTTAPS